MTTPADTAAPARSPDPRQDQAAARTLRLLSLVRTLLAFGKQLAESLRGANATEAHMDTAMRFGTKSIAVILTRLARGLALAAALEAKLADRAEHPRPVCAPRECSPRKPREKTPNPRADESVSELVALPTAEEIADQLRRRPVHAILIDICSDLGILPADPMYRELFHALLENGGSIVTFFNDVQKRTRLTNFYPPGMPLFPPELLRMPRPQFEAILAAATGPP